jgi:hypothetical protein
MSTQDKKTKTQPKDKEVINSEKDDPPVNGHTSTEKKGDGSDDKQSACDDGKTHEAGSCDSKTIDDLKDESGNTPIREKPGAPWKILKLVNNNSAHSIIISQFRSFLDMAKKIIDDGTQIRFKIHSLCVMCSDSKVISDISKRLTTFKFISIEEPFGDDVDLSFLMRITDEEIIDLIATGKRLISGLSGKRFSPEKITLRDANILLLKRIREKLDVMDEIELIQMIGKISVIYQKIKSINSTSSFGSFDDD